MARIKWLQHPTDPALNGTEAHVSRSTADVLCAMKQVEISPYKGYVDFLSSCHREGSSPQNVNPSTVGDSVVWSCSALATTGRPVIWRKVHGETARLESEEIAIQHSCPDVILKQFRALLAVHTGGVNAAEAARAEQVKREGEEKLGVWQTIFSGRA